MINSTHLRIGYGCLLLLITLSNSVVGQSPEQAQMSKLSYLVGEWVGTTTIFENGTPSKSGSAFEKITYDLDKNILVIELNTEFLQLRTIINYSVTDQKYYYHRFSNDGSAIYPAEFKDGQLIVWKDAKTRFFFRSTDDGGFQEYGEQLIDDQWIRTFEDNFKNTE